MTTSVQPQSPAKPNSGKKLRVLFVCIAIPNEEWSATDLVINMSGYPKQRAFPRSEWHKVEDWDVEDPYGADPLVYQRIFEDIRTRIESLTARLRDGHA